MADTKKEQEREELHRAIWAIADELRGAVDGWDFKNYILGTMFYRYISENLENYIDRGEREAGNEDFRHTSFELIVSNPPYSIKWAGDGNPLLINDPRFFPAGMLAPKSKADMAFIMHSLSWLASNGTAAIVCFPGVMYRGGAEQKIRKYLVDNSYNLSVSTYVEAEDTREKIDIVKLNAEIEEIVAREQVLRDEKMRIISAVEAQDESGLELLIKKFCPREVEYKNSEIYVLLKHESAGRD